MKKTIFLLLAAIVITGNSYGQDSRKTVAVIPAEGASVSQDIRIGVTNGLQEGVFQSGEYRLLARGKAFEKALSEMKFQESGAVSDNQLTEFGHAAGADFVCYATLSKYSENSFRISYKMIDVASGEIVNMGSETVRDGVDGLLTATDNIAKELFGSKAGGSASRTTSSGNSGNRRNGEVYNPDGIELVYVAGTGSGITATKGFYIGKYEVTQGQWRAVMGSNPSNFKSGDNYPVEMVSWNDAQEFISRLNAMTGRNYRLPTEAEWEFAARGGTANRFCPGGCEYSGSNTINNVAWYEGNSGSRTHPVGTKSPNELGIYDMSGNVWEWCEDWYDSNRSDRVVRGGSWSNIAASCSVADRRRISPGDRIGNVGFRLVFP